MKRIFLSSISIVILFLSCTTEEFFELENPPQDPWQDPESLEFSASSTYNRTFYNDWGNPVGENYLVFECIGDHVYLLPNTSADIPYNELYFRQFSIPLNDDVNFSRSYESIGVSNSAIEFYLENDGTPFPSATANQRASMDRILGELYFMRGYNYWHLALRHLPKPGASNFETEELLPKRVSFPENAEEAVDAEYMTGKETYDLILADLKRAKELLPEQYRPSIDDDSYEFGRANRYVASGMLAKVYFMLGTSSTSVYYDSALTELDYVISGPYSLDQDPIEAFNRSDETAGNEVIWYALHYDQEMEPTFKRPTSFNYSDYRALGGNRGENQLRCPWNQFPLSFTSLQEIGWFDANRNSTTEALSDKRYQQLYYRLEGNRGVSTDDPRIYEMLYTHITDAQLWGDKYYRAPVGAQSNIPVMRLAEMLLSRSILRLVHNNDVAGALEDLNVVRNRAGIQPLTTAELTEEAIHNERLKELAFEMDWTIYQMSIRMPIGTGDREEESILLPPYEGVYFQIPQAELDFQ